VRKDGHIILKDMDDPQYVYQEEFWENKEKNDKATLAKMNKAINNEFSGGEDSLKGVDEKIVKKSLRNTFNFVVRSSQTFNLPIRTKGFKTEPPQQSNYSVETTQWMIFDTYLQTYEDQQR
jgi:hypothetical protein